MRSLTAAGHDRLSAVGHWVKRASQGQLVRLGCPYDPLTGRYRCPDEATIRTVLDRLTPKALSRALLGWVNTGHRRLIAGSTAPADRP